ncbi:hypothetical protein ACQ4PT_042047 [Festuca glaucescens]
MAEKVGTEKAGTSGGNEEGIDDMLSHLELNDDELDDVVFGVEAAKEYQKAARWLAIDALSSRLEKVVHQGPWTFRGWGLLVEDYDGLGDPEEFVFGGMHVWAQIHGIPELYQKDAVVDDLARWIGKVKEVQMSPKLFFEGNYVRIRVRIEVSKPLPRFVSLTLPKGKKRLAVKYEKVQSTYACSSPICASAPSRGGWAGRGMYNGAFARKRTSEDASLDDDDGVKDTASSPGKPLPTDGPIEDETDSNARKKLDMDGVETVEENEKMDTGVGDGVAPVPPPPPAYVKNKDKKQRKENLSENNLASSAASLEEDRRA